MHNVNWDDYRFVLSVCEAGSVNGAAKLLKVNHATVLRRIAAFEQRHGVSIFLKSGKGYKLNPDSARILASLRDLDEAVTQLERRLQGHESAISGKVRITATDSFSYSVFPEMFTKLCGLYQHIQVGFITTNNPLDLKRTEADIAVRASDMAPDGLVSRNICPLRFAVYHAPAVGSGHDNWILRSGLPAGSAIGRWQAASVDAARIAAEADTFLTVSRLVQTGAGRGLLPCVLGDGIAGLERVDGSALDLGARVWVACHHDMMQLPHIRACFDFLCEELTARAVLFEGRQATAIS
jgi:DNA-binding transcriptional LysR family regulator